MYGRGWRHRTHKHLQTHTHIHTHIYTSMCGWEVGDCLSWAAVHLARYPCHQIRSHNRSRPTHTHNQLMWCPWPPPPPPPLSPPPSYHIVRLLFLFPTTRPNSGLLRPPWWDGEIGFVPWKNRPKMKVLSLVRLPSVSFAENLLVAWTHVA